MTTPPENREAALAELRSPEAREMMRRLWEIDDDPLLTEGEKDALISQACARLTGTEPDEEC